MRERRTLAVGEETTLLPFLRERVRDKSRNTVKGLLSRGQVLVDGVSVVEEPERAKRSIGYLPEQPPLYPDMTVEEYLFFCAALKKVAKGEREGQVARVLDQTDLNDAAGRLIAHLSKGFKQRVGLAQAMLGAPKLLILDEPTVGPQKAVDLSWLHCKAQMVHRVVITVPLHQIFDFDHMTLHAPAGADEIVASAGTRPGSDLHYNKKRN